MSTGKQRSLANIRGGRKLGSKNKPRQEDRDLVAKAAQVYLDNALRPKDLPRWGLHRDSVPGYVRDIREGRTLPTFLQNHVRAGLQSLVQHYDELEQKRLMRQQRRTTKPQVAAQAQHNRSSQSSQTDRSFTASLTFELPMDVALSKAVMALEMVGASNVRPS